MAEGVAEGAAPPAPPVAAGVFGDALPAAERYAALLASAGVTRGLIGPRELPRLWERHILNSAAVAEAVPEGARVVDVGSGAGLPGTPLALARPDVVLTLVEPMARRVEFLEEAVAVLERAYDAATRFNPGVKIRVSRRGDEIQVGFADLPEEGDEVVAVGDRLVFVESGIAGTLEAQQPHDRLVVRSGA